MAETTVRTPDDFTEQTAGLRSQLVWLEGVVDPEGTAERIAALDGQMESPDFWNDQKSAAKVSAERTRLHRKLEQFNKLRGEVDDLETLLEMARDSEGSDQSDLLDELEEKLPQLDATLGELQEAAMFAGEYDAGNAMVSINSGEGGVDAQDWAEMLLRMYLRFCERRGFKAEVVDRSDGEQAGIKSATFSVAGDYAYGVMNAEAGVHRLVRLSPFDSANRRQTSFASVEVWPEVDDDVDVEINPDDLRVDTYRSSGAGGQHVNKTDSAIRLTHLPTGIVVQCQNERSQHANKDTAMKMLRGKIFELELQKRDAKIAAEKGEAQNVGFGSQIRSYVLHPYQMVKDLRTRHETGNVDAVLDGDLDAFIRALLLQKAQGNAAATE